MRCNNSFAHIQSLFYLKIDVSFAEHNDTFTHMMYKPSQIAVEIIKYLIAI
jgi:hypothetical protein